MQKKTIRTILETHMPSDDSNHLPQAPSPKSVLDYLPKIPELLGLQVRVRANLLKEFRRIVREKGYDQQQVVEAMMIHFLEEAKGLPKSPRELKKKE